MLHSLSISNFKSFHQTGPIEFAPVTVLFGPNAAGKSNFLDALQLLTRLASEKTLADAFKPPVRGREIEAFRFGFQGLAGLMGEGKACFEMETVLDCADGSFKYRVEVSITPSTGVLAVEDEYLADLKKDGDVKGAATIEMVDGALHVRRKGAAARPYKMPTGQPYTQLSDRRFTGENYRGVENCRNELSSWLCYYLDPRVAMRAVQNLRDVRDIGSLGEHLGAFMYRLKNSESPRAYEAIQRTLKAIIPSIDRIDVQMNPKLGDIEIEITQNGVAYSSRLVSEGTLRVMALACISVNPWGGSLVAFEEPENGVHPRRIALIARLLSSLAERGRQVIVTTHSPLFCGEILRVAKQKPDHVRMYSVTQDPDGTHLTEFSATGPLFEDEELLKGLGSNFEDGVFEGAMLRGLIDG